MRAFLRYRVSLLVLEATDRRCNVHALGPQESVIAVLGQRHGEGVVAIKSVDIRFYDSCGTPEGRYVAQLMEGAALEAGARWESGKAVGIGTVAIIVPATSGFKILSGVDVIEVSLIPGCTGTP